jgi:small subunit ribosomal protein S3
MIERDFLKKKMKLFEIEEYIANTLDKPGYSHTEIQRTPLGEKVIIYTSRPGLIVGVKGANIRALTEVLKNKFGMENPQIEVSEVLNPNLNAHSIAKHIVHTFERFGPKRFKFMGYKLLEEIMAAGALGAEIVISGRGIPGERAKTWRFSIGHLKKSGDIAESKVGRGFAVAHLKSGSIGVKVSILTPDIILPDKIIFKYEKQEQVEEEVPVEKEVEKEVKKETKKEEKKKVKPKKETKKKTTKKKNGNTKKKRN